MTAGGCPQLGTVIRKMNKFLFAILLLFQYGLAYAETNIVDSLEWMTVDSPLIVRGKVTDAQDTTGPHAVIYRDITIRIQKLLKGSLGGDFLNVRLRLSRGDVQGVAWKESGHSLLLFLRKGREADDKALAGRWVLRERCRSVIDLEQPERVYKADMKYARDAKEILGIVRHWATWKKELPEVGGPDIFKPQTGYLRLEIPPGADIYPEVFAGSACYINVPAEEKYRSLALSKARSMSESQRIEGAQMLQNYPGPETIQVLRLLLYDTTQQDWFTGPDRLIKIYYLVRRAAYESLLALGRKPTKPTLERSPTPEEIQNARYHYWERTVWELLPEGWIVSSIKDANEPQGWTRTSAGEGIAIECVRSKTSSSDSQKEERAALALYVMPGEWEGCNTAYPQEKLVDSKYPPLSERLSFRNKSCATYLGHDGGHHFFFTITNNSYWPDACERIRRYFPLKIDTAEWLLWHRTK